MPAERDRQQHNTNPRDCRQGAAPGQKGCRADGGLHLQWSVSLGSMLCHSLADVTMATVFSACFGQRATGPLLHGWLAASKEGWGMLWPPSTSGAAVSLASSLTNPFQTPGACPAKTEQFSSQTKTASWWRENICPPTAQAEAQHWADSPTSLSLCSRAAHTGAASPAHQLISAGGSCKCTVLHRDLLKECNLERNRIFYLHFNTSTHLQDLMMKA